MRESSLASGEGPAARHCPARDSLFFGFLGGEFEGAGEGAGVGGGQNDGGADVDAEGGGGLDEFAGVEAAQDLGVTVGVAAAFEQRTGAVAHQIRQGEGGLRREADRRNFSINSGYTSDI